MGFFVMALAGLAFAQDGIDLDRDVVRFGAQPFESSTTRRFTLTNVGDAPVAIRIESVVMGDDFSPGQPESTCPLTGTPTLLLPGESCFHAVGFQPAEFFGGHEVAWMRVLGTDESGAVVFRQRVKLTGTGFHDGDRVVDLSDAGVGPFAPTALDEQGIVFLAGGPVELVEGDEALIGPILFHTADRPRAVQVTFAPTDPGTAWYQLSAFAADGRVLAWTRLLLAQDPGDPLSGPLGYVEIELVELPVGTAAVGLVNRFVSSSDPAVTGIGFGVAAVALFDEPLP